MGVSLRWKNRGLTNMWKIVFSLRYKFVLFFVVAVCTVPAATAQVSLYEHCNYGGYNVPFSEGSHNLNGLVRRGVKNDDVSSLRIASGYSVTVYEHNNYQGKSKTFTGDDSCIVNDGFNDIISSIKVTRTRPARDTQPSQSLAKGGVNGKNVAQVAHAGGRFTMTSPGKWTEFKANGVANFSFTETARDEWSVYLKDTSRNSRLQIDIHRKMISYGTNGRPVSDLYPITESWRQNTGGSCGIAREATVYTGCGYTYQSKANRDTQCGRGGTSKFIYDDAAKSSCGIARSQTVYTGCGYTYQKKSDRDTQCGSGGTSKFIPAE